nr:hypothetical protein [uncultured Shinella sp.]
MLALANHPVPSFFEDIPFNAKAIVAGAWDAISESQSDSIDGFYIALCGKLQAEGIKPPARYQFVEWYRKIRAGTAPHPFTGRTSALHAALFQPAGDPVDRALKAYAIVSKAVQLQQAMIEGGYSPDSVEMEDQIVAEAIKDWLAYEASAETEESGSDTKPVELAFGMLRPAEARTGEKLLDILSTHMQRELALAIVNAKARAV